MGQGRVTETGLGLGSPTLFLLSFRQRDELSNLYARAGWQVVAARRAEGVAQRFRTSGAAVAVVDARGAADDGLSAVTALDRPVASSAGALLALVSRGDADRLGDFLKAGATHFVLSPATETELAQAVRFALRHVERLGGGWRDAEGGSGTLAWRYDPAVRSLQLTPALASMLRLPQTPAPRQLLAALPDEARRGLRGALRQLGGARTATAFAHGLPPVGRVVEHLQRDARTGRLHGLVETLSTPRDIGAAVRDALSGARDLRGAVGWLERRLAAGSAVRLSVVVLGGIEAINRELGREAGDQLLRAALTRVQVAVRGAAGRRVLVARGEGAEFLLALDTGGGDTSEAFDLAVTQALARPFVAGERVARLSARVAQVTADANESAAQLLARGRAALEETGSDRRQPSHDLDGLAADVQRAIDADEVDIVFQPQVAIGAGRIVGVEALARWRHPDRGQIGPEALFAAAERAGLAVALSSHVQARALRQAARWPAALRSLRLSVNVTAQDVAQPDFVDALLGRVDDSGFPRGRLTLEITEGGLIEDLADAARLLAELRVGGCRVAIDDFGTGYSSLAYLKALPLDYLKIDKRLTQDITGSPRDRVVVRGVIDMARSLGLAVIAEGVESAEQLDLLAKEGCQYFQGYLCAAPLSVPELEALIAG